MDPPNMTHVQSTFTQLRGDRFGRSGAQPKRFIATDVKHREGEQRTDLGVQIVEQLVTLFTRRVQQIIGFAQFGELRMLENRGQMPERLLISQHIHMPLPRVADQLGQVLRCERTVGWPDEWVFAKRELIFHVVREQVHLQLGSQVHMLMERGRGGTGTAREVVLETAPLERRPIPNLKARQPVVDSVGANHLAQCLHSIKEPGRIMAARLNRVARNRQNITLGCRVGGELRRFRYARTLAQRHHAG